MNDPLGVNLYFEVDYSEEVTDLKWKYFTESSPESSGCSHRVVSLHIDPNNARQGATFKNFPVI